MCGGGEHPRTAEAQPFSSQEAVLQDTTLEEFVELTVRVVRQLATLIR